MLIVPTEPLFLETMVRFVTTFIPTLTIHRVHIAERTDELISLQIEMTDGSIMFVEAEYSFDRIQLILEYGWQRVDVWMYSNFPIRISSTPPNAPLSVAAQPAGVVEQNTEAALKVDGLNKISMDGVLAKDVNEDLFEFGRETGFIECSFGDLLRHRDLSRVQRETIFRSIQTDVVEEGGFVFEGDVVEDGTLKQCQFPKTCSGFQHSIFRPSTVDSQLEQSF